MSQTPDSQRRAEEKHPEVFGDPDAGQASFDDRRPPESFELSALRKGCLWALVLTALFLFLVAVTWRWAWREAPPRLPEPADRDRPGVETEPPGLPENEVTGGESDSATFGPGSTWRRLPAAVKTA